MDDVDADEFQASDGFNAKGYNLDFWLTPASLYRFTEFGKAMGGTDDMTVLELAEYLATCGEALVVAVGHRPDEKNPERVYLDIDNPVPLSAYQG